MQSFDHGYYLLVKSLQELREKKEGLVTVGIGGPSGSGKTRYVFCTIQFFYFIFLLAQFLWYFLCLFDDLWSLAEKVASVIGCDVISMENYRTGVDDVSDLDSIDFDALVQNLEVCISFSNYFATWLDWIVHLTSL